MGIPKAIVDLRQQIHDDLRRQHPEWVLPNGESPMCDAYEARLMDLLALRPWSSYDAQSNGSTSENQIDAAFIFARADLVNRFIHRFYPPVN